ncbi:MAG: VanW family protein [Eubacteriales bacterium]|nr:VanW family protein [Eubacteriales bacterium]
MKNRFARRAALFTLSALLLLEPLAAIGETAPAQTAEESTAAEQTYQYYALTTVALKVRRRPEKDAPGIGSIAKGATVFILEMTDENWALVEYGERSGYIQRQYLEYVTPYDGAAVAQEEQQKEFSADTGSFREAYIAYAVKEAGLRSEPNEDSKWILTIPTYKQVTVSVVDGDWCYANYQGHLGYIRCDSLFKWDRLVADAGEIPGLDILPLLVFVNHSTNLYSMEDNSVLKTINPGAAIACYEKDAMGRYQLPYWRTTGYIREEDVAYVMPVADYETAQPGELISVMSTYYAVGVTTVNYQGRNWNIHLASSMINGYVLQPGENYDQYQVIGPYRKSTGYHSAPIMKKDALTGYGGGTCQVNTTFYITNIQVPIVVTHRVVHADVGIYYAKKGFDAAVGGGDINLTLTNTLPYAIRYQFFDSDGVLTCCIFRDGE